MTYRSPVGTLPWLLGALWLSACSSSGTTTKTDPSTGSCADGKTKSCDCSDVGSGKQTCEDGEWSDCVCSGKDAGRTVRDAGRDSTTGSSQAALVPCEVQSILTEKCGSCHGASTDFAAPMSMVTYADLMAPSPKAKDKKVYEQIGVRIHDERLPMPPASDDVKLSEEELATLDAWIEAGGQPRAAGDKCATPEPDPTPKDAGQEPVEDKYADLKGPEDCEQTFDFKAHDPADKTKPYVVPGGASNLEGTVDRYICFYFKPPYVDDSQGLWFASMLDQTKILHHWLLYGTDAALHGDGEVAPCSAAEPGAYLLAGWAPGANDVTMPSGIGLDMPSGPTAGLILEVHYYNTEQAEVRDQTGMRLCTAKPNTREHTAAVHFTGSEGICVPPGAKSYEVNGRCNPRRDQGDIHIIQVWPHMHKQGRRMRVTINRQNGTKEELSDQPFDFNTQLKYEKNDIILKPGDTIDTTCFYDNDGTSSIPFGEKTSNEMCFGFITAWPAGALAVDPASLNPVQNIGLGIQPSRRCLDPVGIFGSCNGLADYPL
ncbi:MAG: hypothetical protein ABW352_00915 [Polyangiales bacterium]